ncbi:hypothetical protein Moror_13381 [Moniliophthora roreri MCA 2997]|uniref:Uncharacterized protein n=1 Tax=Moniliophthora roreri (strain MCA 2997) TaxID=1381753 RepID=V2WKK0_MONRO|nr:hypothetical protein Moror_13381 [Moniliophthora roreri MCA 2997]
MVYQSYLRSKYLTDLLTSSSSQPTSFIPTTLTSIMSGPAVSALSHDSVVESHIFDILSGLKGVLSNLDHVTLAHGILAVVDAEVDLDEEMGNLHENDDIPELQDMLDKDYSDNKLNWSSNDEDHERKSPEEQQGHCNVPSDSGTMDVDVNEINKSEPTSNATATEPLTFLKAVTQSNNKNPPIPERICRTAAQCTQSIKGAMLK